MKNRRLCACMCVRACVRACECECVRACSACLGAASHAQADQGSAAEGEGLGGLVGQTNAVRDVQVLQVSQTLQQPLCVHRDKHKVYLTYYSNINRSGKGGVCTNTIDNATERINKKQGTHMIETIKKDTQMNRTI